VKEDLLVIEFKQSNDAPSCIPAQSLTKHKHRLHLITQTYDVNAPLVQKFGIKDLPEIVLYKGGRSHWVSGIDSLMVVLETVEQEE
jgi:hypothetical protein